MISFWFFCHFFYIKPYACARYKYDDVNLHFPILNIHKYPEEFFLRIDLPENLTVQAEYIGLIKPCLRTNPTTCDPWTSDHARDYMCYYVNSSTIYAFNSKTQLGSTNSVNFDIYIYFDRLYYHENTT